MCVRVHTDAVSSSCSPSRSLPGGPGGEGEGAAAQRAAVLAGATQLQRRHHGVRDQVLREGEAVIHTPHISSSAIPRSFLSLCLLLIRLHRQKLSSSGVDSSPSSVDSSSSSSFHVRVPTQGAFSFLFFFLVSPPQ